ncbi:PR domain zinc finger protein 14 isoform X2 [Gallus gallus]|uniref:PR domain zinc finger protein 14 isoform X2 n=1 Tax=Gallus gallus TaxID=9031 RepID=UPI001AE63CFF|nr:PR domain zinc finger protein 14 isoform X2 [Gallus gallus]
MALALAGEPGPATDATDALGLSPAGLAAYYPPFLPPAQYLEAPPDFFQPLGRLLPPSPPLPPFGIPAFLSLPPPPSAPPPLAQAPADAPQRAARPGGGCETAGQSRRFHFSEEELNAVLYGALRSPQLPGGLHAISGLRVPPASPGRGTGNPGRGGRGIGGRPHGPSEPLTRVPLRRCRSLPTGSAARRGRAAAARRAGRAARGLRGRLAPRGVLHRPHPQRSPLRPVPRQSGQHHRDQDLRRQLADVGGLRIRAAEPLHRREGHSRQLDVSGELRPLPRGAEPDGAAVPGADLLRELPGDRAQGGAAGVVRGLLRAVPGHPHLPEGHAGGGAAPAAPRRRRGELQVRALREGVRLPLLPRQTPQVHALRGPGRQEIPLPPLQPLLREEGPAAHPRAARPREAQTPQVLGVREELLAVLQPEQTHAGSLRGAPLQMRLLQ